MKEPLSENKLNVREFVIKLMTAVVAVLAVYYMTIATFVEKTLSFIETADSFLSKIEPVINRIEPILVKFEGVGNLIQENPTSHGFVTIYENFANRTDKIRGEKRNRLRESTKKILNNLSPIFDEQVKYYKKNVLPQLNN